MANTKARKRQSRRDRRLAKASAWTRAPKQMGGKIGHGIRIAHVKTKRPKKIGKLPAEKKIKSLKVPLFELARVK